MHRILSAMAVLLLASATPVTGRAEALLKDLVVRLTRPPDIKAETGFRAKLLVPPGQLYDPLMLLLVGEAVWLNDDGGEEHDKGSRLLALDRRGGITVLAGLGKLMPTVGFDLAPAGFGAYAGQVFSLAQPKVAEPGALANHIVQRSEPARGFATSVLGMDFAPPGFGAFGGQLFFAEIGQFQIPVQMTQPLLADGKVYRLTPAGKAIWVASGLVNPIGLRFVRDQLWVSDINGDFITGRRELPDGFVVVMEAK